jgi:predicted amidohydrolase
MFKSKVRAMAFVMSYLSSPERVREQVQRLDIRSDLPAPFVGAGGLKVSAVRFSPRRCKGIGDYVSQMNELVAQAVAAGSRFVAFPELCGMAAVTLLPRFPSLLSDLQKIHAHSPQEFPDALAAACEAVQGFVGEVFHNTFSPLAKGHRAIIAAGGVYQVEGGRLVNRQYLFSETGEVAGLQDKLFLSPLERRMGVAAGERLTPAETRLGRVALLTASAAPHYEPFLVASAMGCSIAVAGASPFGEDCSPLRFRAEENRLCIVSAGISGSGELGLAVDRAPAVFAPRVSTRTRDGQFEAKTPTEVLSARLDLTRAAAQFDLYSADRNPEFFHELLRRGPPPTHRKPHTG